jgi:hypothetical protein
LNHDNIKALVCNNTGLLGGGCIAEPCKPIPQPSFIEFPLREILINTYFGTQFNVELSYWKINNILDNCGNIVSPKSNQNDGDKDAGLPPFGVMPQQADSSQPYAGLPPISPFDREGVIELSRLNDLGKPNPDNAPSVVYWLEFKAPHKSVSWSPSCSTRYSKVYIEIPTANYFYSLSFRSFGNNCNIQFGLYDFTNDQGQVFATRGFFDAFGGVITYGQGESLPANVLYSLEPV